MIETYLLEQLVAFRDAGTLSAAADHLHLTQPTLTRSMNKLEELFEVPLFMREKKRIFLNENGILAAQCAEDILAMHENMVAQVKALDRRSRTITVGYNAPGPIMELMPLLTSSFVHMAVSTELGSEPALLQGLVDKTYQMIILDHPVDHAVVEASSKKSIDCYSVKCTSEQLCAALPRDHRLAGETSISFSDMDGESFLMANEVGIWEDIVRSKMPSSKFLLQEGTDSLLQIVENSSLPSFATDITMRVLGGRGNRSVVPFSDPEAGMDFYCICQSAEKTKYKAWFESLRRRTEY